MQRRSFFKELTRQTLSAYQLDKTQKTSDNLSYEVMSASNEKDNYIITDLKGCFELQDLKSLGNVILSDNLSINFQEVNNKPYTYLTQEFNVTDAPILLWQPKQDQLKNISQNKQPILILLHWFTEESLLKEVQNISLKYDHVDIFVGNLKDKITQESPAFMRIQAFIDSHSA